MQSIFSPTMDPNMINYLAASEDPDVLSPESNPRVLDPADAASRQSQTLPLRWDTSLSTTSDMNSAPQSGGAGGGQMPMPSYAQPPPLTSPESLYPPVDPSNPYVKNTRLASTLGGTRKSGPSRKRSKMTAQSPALDSVDYWLQFDDDDLDTRLGGSFEIDFSKRVPDFSGNTPKRAPMTNFDQLNMTPGLGTGLYSTSSFLKPEDFLDDSALDHALSEDEDAGESTNLTEEMSKIDSVPSSDLPQRESLYSTPLSWDTSQQQSHQPVPPLQHQQQGAQQSQQQQQQQQPPLRMNPILGPSILSEAEQRRLLAVAMNTSRSSSSYLNGIDLGYTGGFNPWFTPSIRPSMVERSDSNSTMDTQDKSRGGRPKSKQDDGRIPVKEADDDDDDDDQHHSSMKPPPKQAAVGGDKGKEKGKSADRTAHNDIERKYRTNLKDRIAELRDSVPALRSMTEDGSDGDAQRAPKVSKGAILTKATEYIHYLERKNKAIMREHQELAKRLQAFEQLVTASVAQPFPMPTYSRTLFDPRGFC